MLDGTAGPERVSLVKAGAGQSAYQVHDEVVTAATVDFRVDLAGFTPSSAITLAHIHTGAAGVSGGVLVTADVVAGQVTLTNGTGTFTRINLPITPVANAQAIINNPAGFYFNVHSSLNPNGVIRGQLVRQ